MSQRTIRYGLRTSVRLPYEQAVAAVREELGRQGFGVLTEIDVAATLRKKLNVEFRPYVILGACNPSLAHRALGVELDIGLLLPCTIIVYREDDPGRSVVAALDPVPMMELTENEAVQPVGDEVRGRLERVLEAVERRGE